MSPRRLALVALSLALLVALGVAVWRWRERAPELPAPARQEARAPAPPPAAVEPPPPAAEAPSAEMPDEPPGLASVDLARVREALPDNLYWTTAAPTKDPRELEERERQKAFRNEQFGRIQSGEASDAEILDYYDYRQRASTDYVAFADYLLEHYGSDLNDQDQTLLHLARRLQLARLEAIPKLVQQARERKAAQDEARRKWLEDEQQYADPDAPRQDSESAH